MYCCVKMSRSTTTEQMSLAQTHLPCEVPFPPGSQGQPQSSLHTNNGALVEVPNAGKFLIPQ